MPSGGLGERGGTGPRPRPPGILRRMSTLPASRRRKISGSSRRRYSAMTLLAPKVIDEIEQLQKSPQQFMRLAALSDELTSGKLLHPDSELRLLWDRLMAAVTAFGVFFVPLEIAFVHTALPHTRTNLASVGLLLDVLWLLDIFVWCMTAVYLHLPARSAAVSPVEMDVADTQAHWLLESRPAHVLARYARSWLAVDVLAIGPPTVLVMRYSGDMLPALKLLGLAKVLRCSRMFRGASSEAREGLSGGRAPGGALGRIRRVVPLFWCYAGMIHTLGCFFWLVGSLRGHAAADAADAAPGYDSSSWIGEFGLTSAPMAEAYLASLYWAATTATTVGYGDLVPVSADERVYATICFVLFAVLQSVLFGTITTLIDGLDVHRKAHAAKQARFDAFLRFSGLPPALRLRVHNHVQLEWEVSQGFDVHSVLAELPPQLRTDVQSFLLGNMLSEVPMFAALDGAIVQQLLNALHLSLHCAGETIVAAGTVGSGMFFVHSGTVAVVTADSPPSLINLLHRGDYFGEISLVVEDARRSASVIAYTNVQLYELRRPSVAALVRLAPELELALTEQAHKLLATDAERAKRRPQEERKRAHLLADAAARRAARMAVEAAESEHLAGRMRAAMVSPRSMDGGGSKSPANRSSASIIRPASVSPTETKAELRGASLSLRASSELLDGPDGAHVRVHPTGAAPAPSGESARSGSPGKANGADSDDDLPKGFQLAMPIPTAPANPSAGAARPLSPEREDSQSVNASMLRELLEEMRLLRTEVAEVRASQTSDSFARR